MPGWLRNGNYSCHVVLLPRASDPLRDPYGNPAPAPDGGGEGRVAGGALCVLLHPDVVVLLLLVAEPGDDLDQATNLQGGLNSVASVIIIIVVAVVVVVVVVAVVNVIIVAVVAVIIIIFLKGFEEISS